MSKSPNPDIIDKIYFRNIYSCQRKIYWYKVKVMETINAVWEHSYGEDCIPNFSANMEQPRHRWYEFKERIGKHSTILARTCEILLRQTHCK